MRQNPERLAWTVLWIAFVAFCAVSIACPLSVHRYLRDARRPLFVQVNAQRGTVRVERKNSNRGEATSRDNPPIELFKGDSVRTGQLNEGLLSIQRGDEANRESLVSVVVFDNSDILLQDAYSPRFGLSDDAHTVELQMKGGRARIEVHPAADGRPVQLNVHTDHSRVHLSEGSYALEVSNQQTTVTARSGEATVHTGDESITLTDGKHAIVSLEGEIESPPGVERDLIVNGDFGQGINTGWISLVPSDPTVRISLVEDNEQPVVQFQHTEAQPQEVTLIQTVNRNVRDLTSLVLHLKVRINYHSLPVCGSKGSECPVMVRIDYKSEDGGDRQWVHGFYIEGDPNTSNVPSYCLTCPDRIGGDHDRIQGQTWFLYESVNLMEIEPPEHRPVIIQSIRIYASGHVYDSMFTDVELLARE